MIRSNSVSHNHETDSNEFKELTASGVAFREDSMSKRKSSMGMNENYNQT